MTEFEIERSERDPARLAAPPDMDQPLAVGQQRLEPRAGPRCRAAFQPRWISESTSHPPTMRAMSVANSHGTLV